jgi:probable biosynthetic protein (TIGR04098 family)
MHRSRTLLHLGMPLTAWGTLSEAALVATAGDIRWSDLGTLTGMPASRHRDAEQRAVYASFYYVGVDATPPHGLAAYTPDDDVEIVSTLTRFGRSMLDGTHHVYAAGVLPPQLPVELPPALTVQLSNVLVCEGSGPDDLRITTPANADLEAVTATATEPDSYRLIREARTAGRFFAPATGAERLWPGECEVVYRINPDRDVNGVGLVYFANYVAFADYAERTALDATGCFPPDALNRRVTLRRRMGYYGNARFDDSLVMHVEAWRLAGAEGDIVVHHRVRRRSDDRLIAVSSVEKRVRPAAGEPGAG